MHANVSRELEWKIFIEAAQTLERVGNYEKAVGYLTNAVLASPENIKWKLWLIASRLQMLMGQNDKSRETIERCCYETPQKQMPTALIEYSKHFEMRGEIERAREIMDHAKRLSKNEWKTHFEAVMFEIRVGCFRQAEEMVTTSLEVYFATGRLWATLIQLQHARAKTKQDFTLVYNTFMQALNEIPKSGEVWCEGARLSMVNNPENPHYNPAQAEKCLEFAIQFTP
jgi:tetratricopeptide (TPR) repeat protein